MLPLGMQCLRMGGTLVAAAQHGGRSATIDIDLLYRSDLNIHGARASTRRDQELVLGLAADGRIDPVIHRVLPLKEAAEAHRIMERQEHVGKIVLIP
jgi:NADPH:quinone reductase-like Zn-dependent oxidoreductase